MKKNTCPSCGAAIGIGSNQCTYCGSVLVYSSDTGSYSLTSVKCPKCGTLNGSDAAYCANCSQKLLDTCLNCGEKISVMATHCVRCGASHSAAKLALEDSDMPELRAAVTMSRNTQYSEAHDIFETLEPTHKESAEFYAAWILNYQRWAASMDNDSTMHSFAAAYRTRARELLASCEKLFPESRAIQDVKHEVEINTRITRPKKTSACFVATAIYRGEDCEEIKVLRDWRDKQLIKTHYGDALVSLYNLVGPVVARVIYRYPSTRRALRPLVDKLVALIQSTNRP